MKALITGANGFVGTHLVEYLVQNANLELFALTGAPPEDCPKLQKYPIQIQQIELRDETATQQALAAIRPDYIFHLAAQAFVPVSFDDPWDTLENNIRSQLNLLLASLRLKLDARLLVIGSAEVYGKIEPHENPINENQPFRPMSPYGVSKVAQDMLALQYFLSHQVKTFRARAFGHIGPGQNTRFALPNFAGQIAAAEIGAQAPVIRVGNTSAERDFTDVRDVVRAYHLIVTQGQPGEAYNICSGIGYTVGNLLQQMCNLSSIPLQIEVDPARLRPVDVQRMVGDNTKLRQTTGWQPTIDIQQSLTDILDYSRRKQA